jgi:hypothetical protein
MEFPYLDIEFSRFPYSEMVPTFRIISANCFRNAQSNRKRKSNWWDFLA